VFLLASETKDLQFSNMDLTETQKQEEKLSTFDFVFNAASKQLHDLQEGSPIFQNGT